MKANDVKKIVHKDSPRPYRVLMNDGEEIIVRQPRKSHVSGNQLALVGECRRSGGPAVERFRLLNTDFVESIGELDLAVGAS